MPKEEMTCSGICIAVCLSGQPEEKIFFVLRIVAPT